MAEKDKKKQPSADDAQPERQVKVNAQYIKDLSFENPRAPKSLIATKEQPRIDINLDLRAQKLENSTHELALHIQAKASVGGDVLFLAELVYAGVFTLENIPENEVQPALLVFCPTLIFPFARRILSDMVRDGGFPPLLLEPIDFGRLYAQRLGQEKQVKQ